MNTILNLVMVAILDGLAFGAYHEHTKDKVEEQTFTAARQAALDAPDPFLELDRFRSAIGDYGKSCFVFADANCKRRTKVRMNWSLRG